MITQLQEQSRQMNDAITACNTAIEAGDASSVPDTALRINPEFRDPEISKLGMVNGDSIAHEVSISLFQFTFV